tara:strand:+ start:1389 stop:2390 length:1002 start_codon:yes stop_codon:yes gene_type:complete
MINWGIIGLGNMSYKFIDAIKEVDGAKLISVASLTKKKSFDLISKLGIDESFYFNSYDQLIDCSKIDAIYIATLNNSHFNLIKKCIIAKKKILCEKPMTLNLDEADKVFKFIKENQGSFLEAFVYRHHKQSQCIIDIIKSGEIGTVTKVDASFGYKIRKTNPDSRLFNSAKGGGAILDVGCYTTSFCLMIAKALSEDNLLNFKLENVFGSICKTGVDELAQADLIFNKNLRMSIKTSLRENLQNNCVIHGTKGKIIIPNPWVPHQKSIVEIYSGKTYYKQFISSKYTAYAEQINFFNKKYFDNESNLIDTYMSNKESLINMDILDSWRRKLVR